MTTRLVEVKECRHGLMCYFPHDKYIGGALDVYGEYNHAELNMLLQMLREGSVVAEIGSNIGCHTVPLAKHVGPSGRVLAFEPQRVIYQMLCGNLAMNGLWNVRAENVALGASAGTVGLPPVDYAQPNNFGGLSLVPTAAEEAPLKTLDSYKLPQLNLLKIDVEGMEVPVLIGAQDTIKRLRPFIYVENDRKEHAEELVTLLRQMHYTLWWSLTPMYNPDNFRKNPENIFKDIYSFDMLCAPKELAVQCDLPLVEDFPLVLEAA